MKTKYYIVIIIAIFVIVFSYTFNSKLDLNGDNCAYYIYSTSLVEGDGYRNISQLDAKASSSFPPGYPILMSAVRIFTDSIVAQKIMNGIFLLISSIVLFFLIRRTLSNDWLALVVAITTLLNSRVLEFTTMMMSEVSYLMFSTLIIFTVYNLSNRYNSIQPFWKDKYFYLLILLSGFSFEIRTQGITLIVAVFTYFLFNRKWFQAVSYGVGTYLITLIWAIRNAVSGAGSSRYLDQIIMTNQWRPEEGYVSFSEFVTRGFDTLQMLITKAIPGSVLPYLSVDYRIESTFGEWLIGIVIIALIVYGFLSLKKMSTLFISYCIFTFGIITLWSAPSEDRYLITILPIMEMGLVLGVYYFAIYVSSKISETSWKPNPLLLLIPILFLAIPKLQVRHEIAKSDYYPSYKNYFKIAEAVKANLDPSVVVCSRKPQLFYKYSNTYCCNYPYTLNTNELIKGLIDSKVDYVVLEQLGYSSTARYLFPAIEANKELFAMVMHLPNPDTYLFKFDRGSAIKKFK